jgi:hypothetical protein
MGAHSELPPIRRLTREQAEAIEDELRRLEADPAVSKTELRLFLQHPMPCGHATGNLLTCPDPPFGCVICGPPE